VDDGDRLLTPKPPPLAATADFSPASRRRLTFKPIFFFSRRQVKCWLAELTFPADGCKTHDSSYGQVSSVHAVSVS